MSFSDAMNILMGNQDAATRYLESTTFTQLYDEFNPSLWNRSTSLMRATTGVMPPLLTIKYLFVKKTNTELDDYVTQEALKGLFGLVEVKEIDIRQNVSSRSSDLLKRYLPNRINLPHIYLCRNAPSRVIIPAEILFFPYFCLTLLHHPLKS